MYFSLYDGIGLKDADELKLSAIGCYRALLRMEKALDGQEFLVSIYSVRLKLLAPTHPPTTCHIHS